MKAFIVGLLTLAVVITLGFSWGMVAFATDEPDDLQSLVIQAADNLDLPLFPLGEPSLSKAEAQETTQLQDNLYSVPLNPKHQSPQPNPPSRSTKLTPVLTKVKLH